MNIDTITPRWLKLTDAAKYSSIGINRLRALASAGRIKGFQDPDDHRRTWIFDRHSLDAYRESQTTGNDLDRQMVLNYLKRRKQP